MIQTLEDRGFCPKLNFMLDDYERRKMQRSDLMDKIKRIQELVKQLNEYRTLTIMKQDQLFLIQNMTNYSMNYQNLKMKLVLCTRIRQHSPLDMR